MGELPIVAVTVHRDGAIVERAGRLPIVGGHVRVRRLPMLLDDRSLRTRVVGAELREVRLGLDLEGIDRAPASEAHLEVREADAAVRRLEAEAQAVREERATIARIGPSAPWAEAPLPDPARLQAWAALGDPLDAWALGLDRRARELEAQLEKAREARDLARWRLQSSSSEAWWRAWAPVRLADLTVQGEGEVDVHLSYRIEGACWTPRYAIHADAALRKARFTVTATVAQATGEDWRGVRLAVSTAPCLRAVDLPELPALRLGKAQRHAPSPWRELPAGLDELFPAEITPPTPPVSRAEPAPKQAAPEAPIVAAPAGFVAPPPMPMAMAPQAMPARSKSAPGLLGRALSAMSSASDEAGFDAPAAAAPRGGGGASPAPQPPPRGPLDVEPDALDYPHLRLAGFDQPVGKRGRLLPMDAAQEAVEAGFPAQGASWMAEQTRTMRRMMEAIAGKPLPSHHVLPGPIEGADYRFEAGEAVEVAADGRWHAVALVTDTLELEVRHRAVPRLDPRAFRSVRARMTRPTPLLPGPVDVHVDGALVLTAPWKGSARGGELVMGLGVEEGLRVARNVRYREEKAGLVGTYRRTHTEVEVEIASSLSRSAEVEVLERVPVSSSDEVVIEAGEASPPATAFTGDEGDPILEGGRRQVLQVPPGGKAVAKLRYAVTLSAKSEIGGGDRRG